MKPELSEQDLDRIMDRAHHVISNANIYLASTAKISPAVAMLVEAVPRLVQEIREARQGVR